jgi:hypothetical protein
MRHLLLSGLIGITLLASGCFEEKDTITVYADGSGVFHTHKKYGEAYSQMVTSNGPQQDLQAAIDKAHYKDLSQWDGFTAWAGCKASMDGKLVVNDAVGYFDDVSKLRLTDGTNIESFTWTKNPDGGFTITWSNIDSSAKNPLDSPASTPEQVQQLLTMMKGLKVDHEVVLPGIVTVAKGCVDHGGRSATAEMAEKDVASYFSMIDDYRARVDKGEISKAQANSEIEGKTREMSMNLRVTCGPGNVDAEYAQFRKDFEGAKAEYASAGTAAKIENAKKG